MSHSPLSKQATTTTITTTTPSRRSFPHNSTRPSGRSSMSSVISSPRSRPTSPIVPTPPNFSHTRGPLSSQTRRSSSLSSPRTARPTPSLTKREVASPRPINQAVAISSRNMTLRRQQANGTPTASAHYKHSFCGGASINEGVFLGLKPEVGGATVAISRKTWDLEVPLPAPGGDGKGEGEGRKGRGSWEGRGGDRVVVRVTADVWKMEGWGYYFHVSELYGHEVDDKPRDRAAQLEKMERPGTKSPGLLRGDGRGGGTKAWDRHVVRDVAFEDLVEMGTRVLRFQFMANPLWAVEIVVSKVDGVDEGGKKEVKVQWDRRIVIDVSGKSHGEDSW